MLQNQIHKISCPDITTIPIVLLSFLCRHLLNGIPVFCSFKGTLCECCLVKLLIFLHFCFYHADVLNCHFRVRKILNLRIFDDDDGKRWMKSVTDKQFEILCVSQVGCCSAFYMSKAFCVSAVLFLAFPLQTSWPYLPEVWL